MEGKLKRELVTESGGGLSNEPAQENDPVSKRRTIRSQYREIENRINERKDELAYGDSNKFMAIMSEVENMHQHVNKPREQVADAETLLGLTKTLAASVKTQMAGGVTPAEFVSCLISEFGQNNSMKRISENSQRCFAWQTFGLSVSPIFMKGPGCMTMIGPMKNKLQQRKMVVRAKRSKLAGKARPEELEKAAEEVTDTDRNMQVMFQILKKEKKAKVENLMLNRVSFAQTVENLFALSFLVKDGRVRMYLDESGSEVVVPTNGPSAEEIKSGEAKNHQFIFRLDFKDWELMKTIVPEGEELMPQRDVFAHEDYAKAKAEPCDPNDPPSVITAPPVKKYSKNNVRTIQNSCSISEFVAGGIIGNWSCKGKRSIK